MQLRAISYQWGKGRENEKFSDVYESVMTRECAEWWQKQAAKMVILLRYLEENIDAPPQWVCTTHFNCRFFGSDRVHHSLHESSEWNSVECLADVKNKFSIIAPIDLGSSISFAKIHGGDLESSSQLIGEILRGEVTFSAIRI